MKLSEPASEKAAQHVEHTLGTPGVNVEAAVEIAEGVDLTKYSPWTWSMFRLYGCLLIGYLCATVNGFDGAVMGYGAASQPAPINLAKLTNSPLVESMP